MRGLSSSFLCFLVFSVSSGLCGEKMLFDFCRNKAVKLLKTQARCPESDKTNPILGIEAMADANTETQRDRD